MTNPPDGFPIDGPLPSFPYDSAELEANVGEPYAFKFDPGTCIIDVVGYPPSDVRELLAAYREHLQLMSDFNRQVQGLDDAFRSGPADA